MLDLNGRIKALETAIFGGENAAASPAELIGPATFTGVNQTSSFADGLTAHAGGGQGSALPIAAAVNRFTTVASAADSGVLPATAAGVAIGQIVVVNAAAANSMNVFPPSGGKINALSTDAAFALAANKMAIFFSFGSNQWHAVLTA